MHILDRIVAYKRQEVASRKEQISIKELEQASYFERDTNSYVQTIKGRDASGVIAEFKRKSPSKSAINLDADLTQVVSGYIEGRASAISILTDTHFFGGNDSLLRQMRKVHLDTPLLRKEFIIDEYQVLETKALGADLMLLICEILTKEEVKKLAGLARSLDLEVLLEMHSAEQLDKVCDEVSMIGVNNRDLTTFEVDYERSKKLYDQLPTEKPKVAESGLSETDTCAMLYAYGFRGFLIGEQFMKQKDPGASCSAFIDEFMTKRAGA